jgi:hypothetical protein
VEERNPFIMCPDDVRSSHIKRTPPKARQTSEEAMEGSFMRLLGFRKVLDTTINLTIKN